MKYNIGLITKSLKALFIKALQSIFVNTLVIHGMQNLCRGDQSKLSCMAPEVAQHQIVQISVVMQQLLWLCVTGWQAVCGIWDKQFSSCIQEGNSAQCYLTLFTPSYIYNAHTIYPKYHSLLHYVYKYLPTRLIILMDCSTKY